MTTPQLTEPDTRIAATYVAVQVIILLLLIFVNLKFGLAVNKFMAIGILFEWLGGLGILLSAYSIRRSLTAMPLPKEHGQLATNGLYKYVRHPMYSSVLLLSLGIALLSGQWLKYSLVAALAVLFYYKSVYEERYLAQKYTGYMAYAKKTARFVPLIKFR